MFEEVQFYTMRVRVNIGDLPNLTGVTILKAYLTYCSHPSILDKDHLDAIHSMKLDTVGKTASNIRVERNTT